jgi:hypothetical protein
MCCPGSPGVGRASLRITLRTKMVRNIEISSFRLHGVVVL